MGVRTVTAILLGLCVINVGQASPWIGTTDPQLHYDLQMLVDHGYLHNSATTFPAPWKGISKQLQQLNLATLPEAAKVAANRLNHYAQRYRSGKPVTSSTVYGSNNHSRFASFDGQQGEKARFNTSSDFAVGRIAAKISLNYLPGGRTNLDQSFLAYQFGDWNMRAGAIDQWWGPAHSTSLILSNNGRPIKALSLSRSSSGRSDNVLLSHIGPWYWTAQVGQLEEDASVENAKIWSTRLALKPVQSLDIAFSWVATWGGRSGVTDSLGEFFDVVTLQKRCAGEDLECRDENYVGHHLAGIDFKYTALFAQRPVSVYGQFVYEGKSGEFNASNKLSLVGISSVLWGAKVYLELSDTNLACSDATLSADTCFYENGTYSSAYRYYNQAIGGEYDREADMLAVGFLKHYSDGDVIELALRQISLDGAKPIETDSTALLTEDITQLSGYYQTVWQNWQVKLGTVVDHSKANQQKSDTRYNVFAEVKYSF